MRTALAILSEKKKHVVGEFPDGPSNAEIDAQREREAEQRWINFLEGVALMATVNALCTIDDPNPENWGQRLGGALGRDAAFLLNLGEPVPMKKLELKS